MIFSGDDPDGLSFVGHKTKPSKSDLVHSKERTRELGAHKSILVAAYGPLIYKIEKYRYREYSIPLSVTGLFVSVWFPVGNG